MQTQLFSHNKIPASTQLDSPSQHATAAASTDNPKHNPSSEEPHAAPQSKQAQQEPPEPQAEKLRSWQRVEQHLVAIRRLADNYDDSQGATIVDRATSALADLLVDSQTGAELDAMDDMLQPSTVSAVAAGGGQSSSHPGADIAAIRTEALKAAQALRNIGRAQLTTNTQCITYATVAPMVADVVRWLESLLPGDITLHLQLPSILSPLREVLNAILDGSARGSIWAQLVAVGDALQVLIVGPSDVLAQNSAGNENPLMAAGNRYPHGPRQSIASTLCWGSCRPTRRPSCQRSRRRP